MHQWKKLPSHVFACSRSKPFLFPVIPVSYQSGLGGHSKIISVKIKILVKIFLKCVCKSNYLIWLSSTCQYVSSKISDEEQVSLGYMIEHIFFFPLKTLQILLIIFPTNLGAFPPAILSSRKKYLSHGWKCSRSGWVGFWATSSSGRCPCPCQGVLELDDL